LASPGDNVDSAGNAEIAGQALAEPPGVKMTGYNRSATEPLRAVIFYASDQDTPFLDLIHEPRSDK
jgi:hypothetical protein